MKFGERQKNKNHPLATRGWMVFRVMAVRRSHDGRYSIRQVDLRPAKMSQYAISDTSQFQFLRLSWLAKNQSFFVIHFRAMNWDIWGAAETEANPLSTDFKDDNLNVVTDADGFIFLAGQNEHNPWTPFKGETLVAPRRSATFAKRVPVAQENKTAMSALIAEMAVGLKVGGSEFERGGITWPVPPSRH